MPAMPTIAPDAEISDVRTALADGAKTLLELRAVPADKRGDTHKADALEAVNFLHEVNLIHDALERSGRKGPPDGDDGDDGDGELNGRRGRDGVAEEFRSLGRQATEADGFEDWAGSSTSRSRPFVVEVRNLLTEGDAGGFVTGVSAFLPIGTPSMVAGSTVRRRAFVRDLMSVQPTGLKIVPYMRELNAVTNETGAQMTSEGSAKAEVTLQFERYNAVVEKITAWLPATDEILTDAPTLRGYIDTRLEYMLMIREEDQVLNGTGTSPQILGVENLPGKQTQSAIAGEYSQTIAASIAKVENVDGEADGVVTNPITFWTAVSKRHAEQFDNGFGGNAPATMSGITWGLPVVRTRAVAAAQAYVGSWRLGSTLFDRQQTTIKVGDQHSDYFIRNLLVILAEKRIAVAWHRENLFVDTAVPVS